MSLSKKPIIPLLATRFLISSRSGTFMAFIAWVTVVGVMLGVLSLTVVTSVINGVEGELGSIITDMNSDVILYTNGTPISSPGDLEAKIREVAPEVTGVTRSFITEIMVSGPSGVSGAVLEGIDPNTIADTTQILDKIVEGSLARDLSTETAGVVLGKTVAEDLGVKVGDKIKLIAPFVGEGFHPSDLENEEDIKPAKTVEAIVSGVFKVGMHRYDSKFVYAPLTLVQRFLAQEDRVTTFKVKVKNRDSALGVSRTLADQFGYPFRSKYWGQLDQNLFYAIRLEKAVIGIILTAILVVAAFNVVSTLMMMIHEKTQDMSILKAMGFKPSSCFKLFCFIGGGIGLIGTFVGVGLGMGVNAILARTRLIELPADIYPVDHLPVLVNWGEISLIVLFSIALSLVATLYPAYKIMKQTPLGGLRHE